MLTCFLKRVLPFILTLLFGIGLGSILGGSSSRTQLAPSYTPTYTYQKGCDTHRRRNVNNSTPSQAEQKNTTPTRDEPVLVVE